MPNKDHTRPSRRAVVILTVWQHRCLMRPPACESRRHPGGCGAATLSVSQLTEHCSVLAGQLMRPHKYSLQLSQPHTSTAAVVQLSPGLPCLIVKYLLPRRLPCLQWLWGPGHRGPGPLLFGSTAARTAQHSAAQRVWTAAVQRATHEWRSS